jgi:glycosyltransferase involved in cell wall biosynthesis
MNSRLKIFTWHIHGSYLYYLAQGNYEIYIPLDPRAGDGYGGRGSFAFGGNVHEVPADEVKNLSFDCILFQSSKNYLVDQHVLFSMEQHTLPKIYLEHDPPRNTPTDTFHIVDDPDITLVHVTHFNNLMWNNNQTPSLVIDHGVIKPSAEYTGELERGIVVINNIAKRGRRLGLDVFLEARNHVPLDLVGMGSKEVGGIGEIPLAELPQFISKYRFFFNPIRYTSLGLSVCEAMMLGMPIVGLATTEMPTVITNGEAGFVYTNMNDLVSSMTLLLEDRALAKRLGDGAKRIAEQRFNITRFANVWEALFQRVTSGQRITTGKQISISQ